MTEFRTEIVKLGPVEKHPNADTLSITNVMGGYPCIVKTGEFKDGDFATYVPVDALVPIKHECFAFLDDKKHEYARIKARKLRGVFSMGLLVPAIPGAMEGEDVTEQLGIKKYERPGDREFVPNHDKTHKERRSETWHFEKRVWALAASLALLVGVAVFPLGFMVAPLFALIGYYLVKRNRNLSKRPSVPVYDIDGYRKYKDILTEGESVILTEKIHGASCRYLHTGKRMHCGSRTIFRPRDKKNPGIPGYENMDKDLWWLVAEKYDLERKLKTKPGYVLFGELFGPKVQDLDYNVKPGDVVEFLAFDVMSVETRKYLNYSEFLEFCRELEIPTVPLLYRGPWEKTLESLAEGKTMLNGAKHIREGWVLRPIEEKTHPLIGRFILKLASESYLTRKTA